MSYVIAYDLQSDNYDEIEAAIKKLGSWCKLQKSVWLSNNAGPSSEIRDALSSIIKKGDKLVVLHCASGWATKGTYPDAVITWMKNNL